MLFVYIYLTVDEAAQTLWLAKLLWYQVCANTYWQCCCFFIRCLLSLMNVFISGPELTSSKILLSVWDWGGGRTPYFMFIFCFGDFKLRIKTYKTAINQNMWRWHFWDFFFQHNDGLWHFNIIFLSCIWQSVSLFYVSHSVGVFVPICVWVFTECAPGEMNFDPCVYPWTQAGRHDLPVQHGGYCTFY